MRQLTRLPRWLPRWLRRRIEASRARWAEIQITNREAGQDLAEWARGYCESAGATRPWSPVLEMFTD